jgi:hypothetical protein
MEDKNDKMETNRRKLQDIEVSFRTDLRQGKGNKTESGEDPRK